jgi:hypothetical protein
VNATHVTGFIKRIGLLLFIFTISLACYSQTQRGRVLSTDTKAGIGYVNVGVIGGNLGTVTDASGNFDIDIDVCYDNDSIRFSMIGYESKTFLISQFKEDPKKYIYLKPKSYDLPEIKVVYRKPKGVRIGTPVTTNALRSGFSSNELGSELGVKVNVRGLVKLEDIKFNVAVCTYDSVTYRLNIYEKYDNTGYRNILTNPIYITFSKDKINDVISFDLKPYQILIEGDVLIALELYKDLGEGRLLFRTEFFTGTTYHRKTSEGVWTASAGVIGMYLRGIVIK